MVVGCVCGCAVEDCAVVVSVVVDTLEALDEAVVLLGAADAFASLPVVLSGFTRDMEPDFQSSIELLLLSTAITGSPEALAIICAWLFG